MEEVGGHELWDGRRGSTRQRTIGVAEEGGGGGLATLFPPDQNGMWFQVRDAGPGIRFTDHRPQVPITRRTMQALQQRHQERRPCGDRLLSMMHKALAMGVPGARGIPQEQPGIPLGAAVKKTRKRGGSTSK